MTDLTLHVIEALILAALAIESLRLCAQQRTQRALQERREQLEAAQQTLLDACAHPAWRIERLAYAHGLAVRVTCFRCGATAGDRFTTEGLSDGSISIVNRTRDVLNLVVDGELHELLPPEQWSPYEDDAHESTYAVYLQPDDDLRKP